MIADRAAPRVADALPLPERYDLGIDVKQNTVYAEARGLLDPRTQLAFTTRYGSVQVWPGRLAQPERCTRARCKFELCVGLRHGPQLGPVAGIARLRSPYERKPGTGNLLSAAHCQGDDRYHSGERYGSVQHQQFRGRVDAERHSIEGAFTASPTIFVDSGERRRIVGRKVSRWEEVRLGRRVCKSGWKTGKTCGRIEDKQLLQPGRRRLPRRRQSIRLDDVLRPGPATVARPCSAETGLTGYIQEVLAEAAAKPATTASSGTSSTFRTR